MTSYMTAAPISLAALQAAEHAPPPTAARLLRFACALRLGDQHRRALAHSAVTKNMEVSNFGCAPAHYAV